MFNISCIEVKIHFLKIKKKRTKEKINRSVQPFKHPTMEKKPKFWQLKGAFISQIKHAKAIATDY